MAENHEKHPHLAGVCTDFVCGRKFMALRIILALGILAIVFCAGAALGRFGERMEGRGGYGRHMNRWNGGTMMYGFDNGQYGPGMMYFNQAIPSKTAPTAPTPVK
jgi:hypothetical protein